MTENTATNDRFTVTSPRQGRLPGLGRWMGHGRPWRSLAALGLMTMGLTALAAPAGGGVQNVDVVAHAVTPSLVWGPVPISDSSGLVAESSPTVANLAGGPAAVFG